MRTALLVVAATFSVLGQNAGIPTAAPQNGQRTEKCIVEGRVVSAVTGEPVSHAAVILRQQTQVRTDDAPGYEMETDDGGTFHFEKVEPAKYTLSAQKTGHLRGNYGARRIRGPGLPVALTAGESLGSLEIKLYPQAVVSGTVTDDRGEPVAARIVLLKRGWANGKPGLVMAGSTSSDDLGNYRLTGAAPGKYFIRAEVGPNMMEAGLQRVDREGNLLRAHLVPTYFGDAATAEAAAPVQLQAGQDVSGTNIKLRRETVFRIRGRIASLPGGDSPLNYYLYLSARTIGVFMMSMQGSRPKRNGEFTIENVPPGDYQLMISRLSGSGTRISVPVQVSGADIDDLEVAIPPPAAIRGRIVVEGSAPVDLSTARLSIITSDGMMYGGSAIASADGSFHIDSGFSGEGRIDVQIPGVNSFVKSVKAGGREMPDTRFDTKFAAGPIEVLVSLNPGKVEGSVTRDDPDAGQAVPAGAVSIVLIPDVPEANSWDGGIRTGSSDKEGHFTVSSLKPGKYKALAVESFDFQQWQDPELPKAFAARGVEVDVAENQKQQIQLKLISADEVAGVLDRLGL